MHPKYPIIGIVDEDKQGIWIAKCGCSGYIDENYDAVVTFNCEKHKPLRKIKF